MKKSLIALVFAFLIAGVMTAVSFAATYNISTLTITVDEPVPGKMATQNSSLKEASKYNDDVFCYPAKWEGTFGGDYNTSFVEGNTYKVTVAVGISDLAHGKMKPSKNMTINGYPMEEYKLYNNDKGIEISITYVCGVKKEKPKTESTSSSSSSSSSSSFSSSKTPAVTYDSNITRYYGEFSKYAKYTPYYDRIGQKITPAYRRESAKDYLACPESFKEKDMPHELPVVATGITHIGDSGKQGQVKAYFAPTTSGYGRGHLIDELVGLGLFYNGPNSDDSTVNNVATYWYTGSQYDVIAYNDEWVAVWDSGAWTTFIQAHGQCGAMYHGRYVKPGIYYYPRSNMYIIDNKNMLDEKPPVAATGTATCLLAIKTAPESKNYIKSGVYKANQSFQIIDEEPINGHYKVYYAGGAFYVNAEWVNVKPIGANKPVITYTAVLQVDSSVGFYDGVNEKGNLLGKGKSGMAVEIINLNHDSTHAKIWFSGKECYINKKYLTQVKKTAGQQNSEGYKTPIGKLVLDTAWADARANFYIKNTDGTYKRVAQLLRGESVNVYGVEQYEVEILSPPDPLHDMLRARYRVRYKGVNGYIIYDNEILEVPFTYYEGQINTVKTTASTQAVAVDGMLYDMLAYNINGNNYFKIRDLAMIFSDSPKCFDIEWDAGAGCINMKSFFKYTPVGGEMTLGDGKTKNALDSNAVLTYDGISITAACYNIDGNNYFKLRDITDALDCRVEWDERNKVISISSLTPAKEDPNEIKG